MRSLHDAAGWLWQKLLYKLSVGLCLPQTMFGVGRDPWSSHFPPPAQAVSPRSGYPWPCPDIFWISPGMETSAISLGNLCRCPVTLLAVGFPEGQMEPSVFQFLPTVSSSPTGLHWEVPGSTLFTTSFQVLACRWQDFLWALSPGCKAPSLFPCRRDSPVS